MSSQYGALKTLMIMLADAPSMQGVSSVFGEENITAQEFPLPMVVVVPRNGAWNNQQDSPGYYKNADLSLSNIWMTQESIDLYLWAFDSSPNAQPIDHADAVEDLRARVLQAFQSQMPKGLKFYPSSGRWELANNEVNRYGRGYVLTVVVDITVPDVLPVYVTVLNETINPEIEG